MRMMLGFVSQKQFDYEHELRVRAEARIDVLEQEVLRLAGLIGDINKASRDERREILDRYAPIRNEQIPEDLGGSGPMTLAQATRLPAIGKGQILDKRNLMSELKIKEETEKRDPASGRVLNPIETEAVVLAVTPR